MIKNIFFDLDEVLIHSMSYDPEQKHVFIYIDEDEEYYTIVRPCAKSVIEYARALVGKDKVFLFTSSAQEYVSKINDLCDFGFDEKNIIHREDLKKCMVESAGGWTASYIRHSLADPKNVLIDNLPPCFNHCKVVMLGLDQEPNNYFQVKDYVGVNYPDDTFEDDVKSWLEKKHLT